MPLRSRSRTRRSRVRLFNRWRRLWLRFRRPPYRGSVEGKLLQVVVSRGVVQSVVLTVSLRRPPSVCAIARSLLVVGIRVAVRGVANVRAAPSQHLIVLSSGSCVLLRRSNDLRMLKRRLFPRPYPAVLPMDVD